MDPIGPGWNDPLLYQVPAQGMGGNPALILAILVALACVLYLIASGWLQAPRGMR